MSTETRARSLSGLTWAAAAAVLALGAGCGNVNSSVTYADGAVQQLADALSEYDGTPYVSDEVLSRTVDALTTRAQEGDVEAALVLFELAKRQRERE